jgi:phage terminase small subunit
MPRTVKKDKNLQPGQPEKPGTLSARASLAWDRLVGELAAANIVLTPAHRTALSMAATITADIADAWATVEKDGAYIAGKAGIVAHPASKRLDALRRDQIKVLGMLGLRAAVATEDTGAEQSLSEVLDG